MLKDYVQSPCTCRRLMEGPAGPHGESFVRFLLSRGYSPVTVAETSYFLGIWMEWLVRHGFGDDVVAGLDAYRVAAAAEERLRLGTITRVTRAGAQFIRFLVNEGAMPAPKSRFAEWPILVEFHTWGREQHGLAESTLCLYMQVLLDLLGVLGDDPARYTAQKLREFVLNRARPHGRRRGETIVCAVRSFLRFLVADGRCRDGLPSAILAFASWKLSTLPRYMEADAVKRVIAACEAKTPVRCRDRAILLLLARLGLRAGDIGCLTFADIDWDQARISVSGKSHRHEWLPLPQAVGNAILKYVRCGRPASKLPNVFLTARAPYQPVTSSAVSMIAGAAIRRAGVLSPSHGAHVFRHSAATSMLRHGATLASIGAVLRHRHPDTTLQYAKVDLATLAEVAVPWPEVSPC